MKDLKKELNQIKRERDAFKKVNENYLQFLAALNKLLRNLGLSNMIEKNKIINLMEEFNL